MEDEAPVLRSSGKRAYPVWMCWAGVVYWWVVVRLLENSVKRKWADLCVYGWGKLIKDSLKQCCCWCEDLVLEE